MMATMRTLTTGPRYSGSRFMSPPRARRTEHSRQTSHPGNRVAGRKTAPGIFLRTTPKTCPENLPQVTETHQENAVTVVTIVLGCVVAPNSVASGGTNISFRKDLNTPEKGKIGYTTLNLFGEYKASVVRDSILAMAFMRKHSPTFEKAYQDRMNRNYGIIMNPILSGGGTVDGSNIVYGAMAGVNSSGGTVWPAYIIAHEFGHTFQFSDRANAAWNINPAVGSPESQIAPNASEWYAYHFAEQVSREIRENGGVDIGSQKNYWDVSYPKLEYRGILPPLR
jgi:hypothetical protein